MYYIIERKYVGPNPYRAEYIDADEITISTIPALTNSSYQVRTDGWCGTTDDYSIHAHGAYETIEGARAALAEKFGTVRAQELGEYDSLENITEKYKKGECIPMSDEETADWAYFGMQTDISADTTDERIEALVSLYQDDAREQGYVLDDDLDDQMRKHRQKLRDERSQEEDEHRQRTIDKAREG